MFFLPILKKLGHLSATTFTLCSVGSRKASAKDDYGTQSWGIFAPNLQIYGFDADADACAAANQDLAERQVPWTERHFPAAVANRIGEATLYVTSELQCTSIYPPNTEFVKHFWDICDFLEVDCTIEIETTTLDAACQTNDIETIDFLQVDVQGAGLQVLEGAPKLLEKTILGLQIEVEFSPLYVGQPLFTDVNQFLVEHGFSLFDLDPLCRGQRSPLHASNRPGQLLWSDAFYFRDPFHPATPEYFKQPDQLFKLACIADCLFFTDYAIELLEYITLNYQQESRYNYADAIVQSLAQIPELVKNDFKTIETVDRLRPYLTKPIAELIQAASE